MENDTMTVKKIIGHDVPPSYPNLIGRIIIHTHTRKDAALESNQWHGKIHWLFNHTSKPRLINDKNIVRKLLSIVENVKNNSVPFY